MIISLSVEERNRFADWLEQENRTAQGIIEQLKKLGPAGEVMSRREKAEAAAAQIIARKLRSIEDASL